MDLTYVNEQYTELFRQFGDSPKSVMIPKDNQNLRFNSIAKFLDPKVKMSYLDYGCGLAHQLDYFNNYGFTDLDYIGVEINNDFLNHNQKKHPESKFLNREDFIQSLTKFDYIGVIGTFNLIYSTKEEQKSFVFEEMTRLWQRTDKILFINFMSTVVDYVQENAYHQELGELYSFVSRELSRKIIIISDYLPFEYTIAIIKS